MHLISFYYRETKIDTTLPMLRCTNEIWFALIKQLRSEFNAPRAKFVVATLGQTSLSTASGTEKPILDAMLAVDGVSGKYPEFAENVATVYSHPLSKGGSSNGHYNGNAETYMNIGEAREGLCRSWMTKYYASEIK